MKNIVKFVILLNYVSIYIFKERERAFKEYEQQYLGTKEDIESQIRRETENTLSEMQRSVAANKQQVIIRLLQLVCDIRPELHHNLILQKDLEKRQHH